MVVFVGVGVATAVSIRAAHADYEDDKNKKQMGTVERALAKYQKDPSLFDGKALVAGADLRLANNHANACDAGYQAYEQIAPAITPKGKSGEQWKKLTALYQERKPWCIALRGAVQSGKSSADDTQNSQKLATIESSLIAKNPAVFDGKSLVAGVTAETGSSHAAACEKGIQTYDHTFSSITAAGQSSAQGKKLTARYQEMKPYCTALRSAVNAAFTQARVDSVAADKAKEDRMRLCRTQRDALSANMSGSEFVEVLETIRGSRILATAEDITKFRTNFEKLVETCKAPVYADFATRCAKSGSIGNPPVDYGDLCVAPADPKKTLTDVALRTVERLQFSAGSSESWLTYLKNKEGWHSTTEPAEYATHFKVSDKVKKKMTADATGIFKAAGIDVPSDLSSLWAKQQASLDELKAAVDQTAAEWKLDVPKCANYGCKIAEREILKAHKKAKIKRVLSTNNFKIVNNQSTNVPDSQYTSIRVVYQLPGEPYCQARQTTLSEKYKGGGKYQKAVATQWGFVRWQDCAK
jgi:hypothetical protein